LPFQGATLGGNQRSRTVAAAMAAIGSRSFGRDANCQTGWGSGWNAPIQAPSGTSAAIATNRTPAHCAAMPIHKTDGAEVLSLWSHHGTTMRHNGPRDPPQEQGKDLAGVKRGGSGGIKGSKGRAENKTASEQRARTSKTARSRWSRP
jgi:hypothetical protein